MTGCGRKTAAQLPPLPVVFRPYFRLLERGGVSNLRRSLHSLHPCFCAAVINEQGLTPTRSLDFRGLSRHRRLTALLKNPAGFSVRQGDGADRWSHDPPVYWQRPAPDDGFCLGDVISHEHISPFIRRPIATTLLVIAVFLAGAVAFRLLPVSPLPQVDFPTISVSAILPGASPEIMASSVATPLERQFGRIAAVTEMTSASNLGTTSVTLQFDLNRNIDAAARDVQASINAARGYLPTNLPSNPTYKKVQLVGSFLL